MDTQINSSFSPKILKQVANDHSSDLKSRNINLYFKMNKYQNLSLLNTFLKVP